MTALSQCPLCWLNIHVWNMLVLRGGVRDICLCLVFKVKTFGIMLAVVRASLLHLSMRRDGSCASCQGQHCACNDTTWEMALKQTRTFCRLVLLLNPRLCSSGLWRKRIPKSKVRRGHLYSLCGHENHFHWKLLLIPELLYHFIQIFKREMSPPEMAPKGTGPVKSGFFMKRKCKATLTPITHATPRSPFSFLSFPRFSISK